MNKLIVILGLLSIALADQIEFCPTFLPKQCPMESDPVCVLYKENSCEAGYCAKTFINSCLACLTKGVYQYIPTSCQKISLRVPVCPSQLSQNAKVDCSSQAAEVSDISDQSSDEEASLILQLFGKYESPFLHDDDILFPHFHDPKKPAKTADQPKDGVTGFSANTKTIIQKKAGVSTAMIRSDDEDKKRISHKQNSDKDKKKSKKSKDKKDKKKKKKKNKSKQKIIIEEEDKAFFKPDYLKNQCTIDQIAETCTDKFEPICGLSNRQHCGSGICGKTYRNVCHACKDGDIQGFISKPCENIPREVHYCSKDRPWKCEDGGKKHCGFFKQGAKCDGKKTPCFKLYNTRCEACVDERVELTMPGECEPRIKQ